MAFGAAPSTDWNAATDKVWCQAEAAKDRFATANSQRPVTGMGRYVELYIATPMRRSQLCAGGATWMAPTQAWRGVWPDQLTLN